MSGEEFNSFLVFRSAITKKAYLKEKTADLICFDQVAKKIQQHCHG
jgi:hypothetical protein